MLKGPFKQLTISLLLINCWLIKAQETARGFSLSAQAAKVLVDSLAGQISKYYVLKDEAVRMSAAIRKKQKEGAYNKISDPHLLAAMLTNDVKSACRDEHFHVEYNPALANELLGNIDDVPKMVAERLEQERVKNFGFKKAEILNGNIGYLEISSFSRLNKYSQETADAALGLLSNADALIIDLRYGAGGSPDMVNHIVSHFFKERTHVCDIYIRCENATLPYWTQPDSLHHSLTQVPIYILTSYKTFSASENLVYELQSLKRATIVGETTRGGAHTVTYRPLSNGFVADIPFGKALDPVTKKNWEGTGIAPDIAVSSDAALETAELKIFDDFFKNARDSSQVQRLRWQLTLLQSVNHPIQLDSITMTGYQGRYGAYQVSMVNGSLYYQKTGKAKFSLVPVTRTKMRPRGTDSFAVEFVTENSGTVNEIVTYYEDGRVEKARRTP